MKQDRTFIATLTPPRGIAALMVILYHAIAGLTGFEYPAAARKLYLFVDLFFILSGFILMHVYARAFSHGVKAATYRQYLVARFARIYPLHVTAILLLILMELLRIGLISFWGIENSGRPGFTDIFDPIYLPLHLMLLQTLDKTAVDAWNMPSWSISNEMMVYFLFPFMVIVIERIRGWGQWAAIGFIAAGYYALVLFHPKQSLDIIYGFSFFRALLGFFAGTLIYRIYRQGSIRWIYSDVTITLIMCAIPICLSLWLEVPTIALFALLVLALSGNKGFFHRLLSTKPCLFLGNISFALYMLHLPVLLLLTNVMRLVFRVEMPDYTGEQAAIFVGSVFLLSILGATIAYRLIEMPTRNYLRKKLA